MNNFGEDQVVGQKLIPGITPDFIISQLQSVPILYENWKANNQQNQKRLIDVMMKAPSNSDCPGYIYGFRTKQGYNSKDEQYMIKIGRTKLQVPQNRIFQWQKDDCHQYVQIFTVRSQFNVKLQALVHLLFAYARKIIYINGKKRIQWFQFHKKIPTAAATNLLNLLMQKVHQRNFQQLVKPIDLSSYQILLNKILILDNYTRKKQRIVVFGLPRTGKTTIGNVLLQVSITAKKIDNQYKLSLQKQQNIDKSIIQVTSIKQEEKGSNKSDYLQKYFKQWHNICSSQIILPVLVVKQTDIESSMLIGLFEGLKLVKKYLKLDRSPFVVVNRSSLNFTDKIARNIYEDSKEYLSQKQVKQLDQLYLNVFKQAHAQGKFPTTQQSNHIFQNFEKWQNKGSWGGVQLKLSQQLIKQCRKIIQMSYQFLKQRYGSKFLQKMKQIKEQNNQIQHLDYLKNQLQNLKSQIYASQQKIHECIGNLNDFLSFTPKQNISSYLYAFCQCVANKSLSHTLIFDEMQTNMNAKISEIVSNQNQKLRKKLQNLTHSIQKYMQIGNRQFLKDFSSIIKEDKYQKIIQILNSIVEINLSQYFDKKVVIDVDEVQEDASSKRQQLQTKNLIQSIVDLVQFVKDLQIYSKSGLRFDSVVGRIKQAIYMALKSQEKQVKKITKFTVVKQTKQYLNEPQKEKQKYTTSLSEKSKTQIIQVNLMSSLIAELNKIRQNITIMNVVKDVFVVDVKQFQVKHNLIILTKSITFAGQNKDKQLTVLSQSMANYEKIKLPQNHRNGRVAVLAVIDNHLTPVDPYYSKHPKKIRNDFYQGLLCMYLQNVK